MLYLSNPSLFLNIKSYKMQVHHLRWYITMLSLLGWIS